MTRLETNPVNLGVIQEYVTRGFGFISRKDEKPSIFFHPSSLLLALDWKKVYRPARAMPAGPAAAAAAAHKVKEKPKELKVREREKHMQLFSISDAIKIRKK